MKYKKVGWDHYIAYERGKYLGLAIWWGLVALAGLAGLIWMIY